VTKNHWFQNLKKVLRISIALPQKKIAVQRKKLRLEIEGKNLKTELQSTGTNVMKERKEDITNLEPILISD
jgi:hypothetical protein